MPRLSLLPRSMKLSETRQREGKQRKRDSPEQLTVIRTRGIESIHSDLGPCRYEDVVVTLDTDIDDTTQLEVSQRRYFLISDREELRNDESVQGTHAATYDSPRVPKKNRTPTSRPHSSSRP